jgi:endonuclease/exonuclease/phosphatase family metal-dependent hydrolase
VDVFTRGERFRYICAHLEEETVPTLQYVQAQELLAGPASTSMPVVLTGDFNADPLHRNGTITYELFGAAGFTDAWNAVNPSRPAGGLTWGHDAALTDPGTPFIWRLDLILYRGGQFNPTQFQVLDIQTGLARPPLWASDHAAVAASFLLGNKDSVKAPMALRK